MLYDTPALGGRYTVTGSAAETLKHVDQVVRTRLGTYILDQHQLGVQILQVNSSLVDRAKTFAPLSVMDRVHRLYRLVAKESAGIGARLPWSGEVTPAMSSLKEAARVWTESVSPTEIAPLVRFGIEAGHFRDTRIFVELTIGGWAYLEQLDKAGSKSDQAFVAMWFGVEVSAAYEVGIDPAIRDAGYIPMRIDQKEHANRIDDEIIAEIRRSRFVVADFTCGIVDDAGKPVAIPRGGVYYEAGFAQGLGIPVIWMCRQDHIEHVHFDTRQFNHITWTDPVDLRVKLKNRIGAVLGDGPHVVR